jgi:hypothetical protein
MTNIQKIKHIILVIIMLIVSLAIYCQDTILVERSSKYSSKIVKIRDKGFASRVKYAREDIVFNDNHKRVEYCYYYDDERHCFGTTYKIINDSILYEDEKKWVFKNISDDSYFIASVDSYQTTEFGYAKSLIPLEKTGLFYTTSNITNDTLWIADYSIDKRSYPFSSPDYCFYQSSISDKIYEYYELDEMPTFENGDSLNNIFVERTDICRSEPLYWIKTVSFIITKDGEVKNIMQVYGNFNLYCPFYLMKLTQEIVKLNIKPAKIDGNPVTSRWFINVDMNRYDKIKEYIGIRNEHIKMMKEGNLPAMYKCR